MFEEVSGKNPVLERYLSGAFKIFPFKYLHVVEIFDILVFGAFDPLGSTAAALLNRIDWGKLVLSVRDAGREYFMHWWQMMKSRERRGATRCSPRKCEAIEVVMRPGEEKRNV